MWKQGFKVGCGNVEARGEGEARVWLGNVEARVEDGLEARVEGGLESEEMMDESGQTGRSGEARNEGEPGNVSCSNEKENREVKRRKL